MEKYTVNIDRIKRDIEELGRFTSTPGRGCTRLTYSHEDLLAREYVSKELSAMDLKVQVDPIGNIRGRLEGTDRKAPVVLTGSHLDTVVEGGKYDGAVGVVGGLEVLRVLVENKVSLKHPVELIVFVEEEGAGFGGTMAGSSTLIGRHSVDVLKELKNDKGISMYMAAKDFGLDPDKMPQYVLKPQDVKGFIELHIEQSVLLDENKIPLGIVDRIAGFQWLRVHLKGVGNHSGATPMAYRQDAMRGASEIISSLPEIIKEKASITTVGTVGKIHCSPNLINVIPETITFYLDIRDIEKDGITLTIREVKKRLERVAAKDGLSAQVDVMRSADPVLLSKPIISTIEASALRRNIPYLKTNSGALHDASMMAQITQAGLIFLPSVGGRSHVKEEYTSYDSIKLGCEVLLDSLITLAH